MDRPGVGGMDDAGVRGIGHPVHQSDKAVAGVRVGRPRHKAPGPLLRMTKLTVRRGRHSPASEGNEKLPYIEAFTSGGHWADC